MYSAHPVEGRQLNDCDAASRFTDKVEAVAHGLYKPGDGSLSARPATKRQQPCQPARSFSFHDGLTLLAAVSWIFFPRVSSEGIPTRKARLTLAIGERRPSNSRSVHGFVDRRLALKLHRSRRRASGPTHSRACCCERVDPPVRGLRIRELSCTGCSVWPIIRGRVRVAGLILSSLQCANLIRRLRSVGLKRTDS